MTKAKSTLMDAVSVRTEKEKRDLVAQLRKTPIVQLACERVGVGRSTYYRWRADDVIFARAADHALEAGKFFINDLAESKLVMLMQDGNITALIFWLKHNHPKYANRVIHEYDLTCDRTSTEEEHANFHEMVKRHHAGITENSSTKDFRKFMEEEDRLWDIEQEDRKKVEAYDDK